MKYIIVILFTFLIVLFSCKEETKKEEAHQAIDNAKIKQQFIKANQQILQKESDEMDYFQKSHQLAFTKTNSGIRYFVYKPSAKGDSIKDGDIVAMSYTLSLLDGTECYSSARDGVKEFMVGQAEIESGIHKGLLFLKNGDHALLLIPSHLAHGLLGDYKKIPPQSPIIYDVEILSVKKDQ